MHLIADHLGWLEKSEQGWTVEGLLKSRGEKVVRLSEAGATGAGAAGAMGEAAGLSPEDVAGWSKVCKRQHACMHACMNGWHTGSGP